MGAGHQQDQTMIRSLEFSALPSILQRGKRGWKWADDQSCLRDEAAIKIPKGRGSESFRVGEHMMVLGEGHTRRGHGSHIACPVHLFHLSVHLYPLSYLFIIYW